MIVVGIDSGKTGAVACIGPHRRLVFDMPMVNVMRGDRMRRDLDAYELAKALRMACPVDEKAVVYLEWLHARAQQGGSEERNSMGSQGAMMETFGGIRAVLAVLRMRVVPTYPQSWKRVYDLDKNKTAARERAQQLFPDMQDQFKRVKDDGRAEAMLIANFGRMKEGL